MFAFLSEFFLWTNYSRRKKVHSMTHEEAKRYIARLTYEEKKRLMQLLKTIEQQRQQPANT